MPVYDYKCNTCGKPFEYKQSITEESLTNCPEEICTSDSKGHGIVSRVFSKNIGLVFKGSGFYQTDYVNSKSPSTESVDKSSTTTPACTGGNCGCHVA